MDWMLRWRIGRKGRLQRDEEVREPVSARVRADFAIGYDRIKEACGLLAGPAGQPPERLAAIYMTRVLQEKTDPFWWRENAPFLAQSWFIWAYLSVRGLVRRPARRQEYPWHMLRPQGEAREQCVQVSLEREALFPQLGTVRAYCDGEAELRQWMFAKGFLRGKEGYERWIDEMAAPILDRAAEACAALLAQGYPVLVEEETLKTMVIQESFQPEHRYWVLEAPQLDKLFLRFPRDQALNRYAHRMGARWNGKYMELSIRDWDKLEELLGPYDFRLTDGAARRMDAWRQAVDEATIYRPRRYKDRREDAPPEDLFKALMEREIRVPEDLRDDNA